MKNAEKLINIKPKRDDEAPFYNDHSRIPTLEDIKQTKININDKMYTKKDKSRIGQLVYIRPDAKRKSKIGNEQFSCYNYFFVSICVSFIFGLAIGVVLMGSTSSNKVRDTPNRYKYNNTLIEGLTRTLNSFKDDHVENKLDSNLKAKNLKGFSTVTFTGDKDHKFNKDIYPKGMTEDMKNILKDNKHLLHRHIVPDMIKNVTDDFVVNSKTVLFDNIYWGPEIEDSLPEGYGDSATDTWEMYVDQAEVIKMELGCGRMQNRLVTFADGLQACVRYRQNTDQIQGEIFSFYVAKLLNITNVAPSVVKIVDVKDKLWKNVANDIATAQWSSNRAVVFTQYIPSLESAHIPEVFKPSNRHLNKFDILKMSSKENDTDAKNNIILNKLKNKDSKKVTKKVIDFSHIEMNLNERIVKDFVELAQWSDLIIFDFLTANLDRIVNNLFNYQWNINIMDGPAHNLARKMDSGLLLFLDNESGLLHGYRLLKKYNSYHSVMLDNLCVFRKGTTDKLKNLFEEKNVGSVLLKRFHEKNNAIIRDILPPLPEKNAKILHERIGKVLNQVEKCFNNYSRR